MRSDQATRAGGINKALTGITGLDEITRGGLPRGRTTLLAGGPGSGKTILALQFLVHGACKHSEPGIFVALEESPARIIANTRTFGWNLADLPRKRFLLMDARIKPDVLQSGDFDLHGLLAVLGAHAKAMSARRIVLDALDVVLALLPNMAARDREVHRLHRWLTSQGLTAIVTAKVECDNPQHTGQFSSFGAQYMVDCSLVLNHRVARGVSQRNLRVQKYRGTSFDENEAAFVIGDNGLEVAVSRSLGRAAIKVTQERLSTGIKRLDTMLDGGFYRGASILLTGFPGTAKTTLSGAFAETACRRGEPTTFVSFDSDANEVIRNLQSVGIQLETWVKRGLLKLISARTITGSAESLLVRIKTMALAHKTRCLVIDPLSSLSKAGNELTAHSVAERLIDWSKADGITLLCTCLVDEGAKETGVSSYLHISTLADTWIHLNYLVQAGERNRGLSIIKSRGTSHSNQVRELVLSKAGITLADIYTARGDVLMGTLRWEKESAEIVESELAEVASRLKRVRLDAEQAELQVRIKSLQTELVAKQVEKTLLARTTASRDGEVSRRRIRMQKLRGADSAVGRRKRP